MAKSRDEHERDVEKADIEHQLNLKFRLAQTNPPAKKEEIPKTQKWKANNN